MQETLTNDNLSDHADGVLCQATPQHVLDVLSQHGFSVQDENDEGERTVWTVTQGGASGDGEERVQPSGGHEAEADGDGAPAADEEQGGDEGEGQQQEDEEQEKEE